MAANTCAACKGVFETTRPDDEAVAEYEALWGHAPEADACEVVCDDCYHAMLADEELGMGAAVARRIK